MGFGGDAARDGPLPLARRRLADAVHCLCDPRPQWVAGCARWEPALYQRLRDALATQTAKRRGAAHRSRLPCSVTVLALVIEIDAAVARWTPDDKGGTVERLRALAARGWRPQDVATIERHCDELERWTLAGTELLTETPKVFLRQPCPRCGARFTYRRDDTGESVRVRCLRVSEAGCTCLGCGGFWAPSEFHWLARLLGCEPLPA